MATFVLVGNSSGGMVVTGVADRLPERVAEVVYLDAFVPEDGQSLFDLIPPERRTVMEELVAAEGDGWLLPRFAPPPWPEILSRLWGVTDPDDVAWAEPRLRATPVGHFTQPLHLGDAVRDLPRAYVRFTRFPHAGFDRWAQRAAEAPGWRHRTLDCGHIAYVSDPGAVAAVLLELAGTAG